MYIVCVYACVQLLKIITTKQFTEMKAISSYLRRTYTFIYLCVCGVCMNDSRKQFFLCFWQIVRFKMDLAVHKLGTIAPAPIIWSGILLWTKGSRKKMYLIKMYVPITRVPYRCQEIHIMTFINGLLSVRTASPNPELSTGRSIYILLLSALGF